MGKRKSDKVTEVKGNRGITVQEADNRNKQEKIGSETAMDFSVGKATEEVNLIQNNGEDGKSGKERR
eukprot:11468655-Ditylum_brightwellii.AAC.1